MVLGLPQSTLQLPLFFAGFVFVAVATFLLYVDFHGRLNRAFAVYLVLRGIGYTLVSFDLTPHADLYYGRIMPYFDLGATFALLAFALVYRERYGTQRRLPRGFLAALVGAAALLEIAYAYDHALFWSYEVGPTGDLAVLGRGPVGYVAALSLPLAAGVALLLARDALRVDGARRSSLLLVAAAFSLLPAYLGGLRVVLAAAGRIPWTATASAAVLSVVVVTALLVLLYRGADGRGSRDRQVRRALFASALALASGVLLAIIGEEPAAGTRRLAFSYFLGGLFVLASVALITYAIVRHQLFDIAVKVKFTIRQSTVAAVFIGLFFVVSESAQAYFSDRTGTYLGIVAAGTLVFAIHPLQRVAERVANAAMPGVKAPGEMDSSEKVAFYRDLVRLAWADGTLTPDERRMLDLAADRLGLAADVARRVERDATPA
ncbi:MAG: hypothetical protein ACT4PT_06770 [Methanobacteriota archaeon]